MDSSQTLSTPVVSLEADNWTIPMGFEEFPLLCGSILDLPPDGIRPSGTVWGPPLPEPLPQRTLKVRPRQVAEATVSGDLHPPIGRQDLVEGLPPTSERNAQPFARASPIFSHLPSQPASPEDHVIITEDLTQLPSPDPITEEEADLVEGLAEFEETSTELGEAFEAAIPTANPFEVLQEKSGTQRNQPQPHSHSKKRPRSQFLPAPPSKRWEIQDFSIPNRELLKDKPSVTLNVKTHQTLPTPEPTTVRNNRTPAGPAKRIRPIDSATDRSKKTEQPNKKQKPVEPCGK